MQFGSIHKYRTCQDNCPAQAAFYKTIGGIWILITSCAPESREPYTSQCNCVYSCSVPVLFIACKIWYVFSMWSRDLRVFDNKERKNGKNNELQEKAARGLEEGGERDASSATISGDLTLWLSARRHKSQIGRTQTQRTHTDRWKPHHGPWKSPPGMSIMDRSDAWDHFRPELKRVSYRKIDIQNNLAIYALPIFRSTTLPSTFCIFCVPKLSFAILIERQYRIVWFYLTTQRPLSPFHFICSNYFKL